MQTVRAYKYRCYPTPEQKALLARTFGCVRFVWNAVLRYRTDAFYERQEKIGYTDPSAFLTQFKKQPETAFLAEVSSVPLQQCLRHQQTAFKHFFAKRTRYPRFKSKKHRQSATFASSAFSYREGAITLAKCSEPLNIRWSRPLPSAPRASTETSTPPAISYKLAPRYWPVPTVEATTEGHSGSDACGVCVRPAMLRH